MLPKFLRGRYWGFAIVGGAAAICLAAGGMLQAEVATYYL
jgi:hypothetical protein